MPCPPGNQYFVRGRVDKDKLKKFLGSNFSKVVAWYKFQPFSSFDFSLKDRAIHKQLRELFDIPYDLFSCCFLSIECRDNLSSYTFSQSFIRCFNGYFDRLSLSIPNLSESNNSYKNSEPASPVFSKILSGLKVNIENVKGIVAVTEIENAVQKYINNTVLELAKAEKVLFELEEEVNMLKRGCHLKINSNRGNAEHASQGSAKNDDCEETEDLITFAEDPLSHLPRVMEEEGSQETRKRRTNKNSEESDIDVSFDGDSNKKESDTLRGAITRSSTTPEGRETRSRSKKKILN
ncbi:BRISC complex subunit Abraxas 2-like isoform X2 [Cylas formicarius]|nr:BRISC complex subunit Abraxas 2-like isoform X2 [Cylas formicarius]XP_060536131.1 BRISC complex subunit Abraxas 2-like isoform X2 [Cylas formicarius]